MASTSSSRPDSSAINAPTISRKLQSASPQEQLQGLKAFENLAQRHAAVAQGPRRSSQQQDNGDTVAELLPLALELVDAEDVSVAERASAAVEAAFDGLPTSFEVYSRVVKHQMLHSCFCCFCYWCFDCAVARKPN